jgi:hypothetical protein
MNRAARLILRQAFLQVNRAAAEGAGRFHYRIL